MNNEIPRAEALNNRNEIIVGNKDPHNYIMYAIEQFMNCDSRSITLQARGHNIDKAILLSLILRDKYFLDSKIDVEIFDSSSDNRILPSINIILTRP